MHLLQMAILGLESVKARGLLAGAGESTDDMMLVVCDARVERVRDAAMWCWCWKNKKNFTRT